MDFNNSPSFMMHVDINSCFATIEQQANPFLRNKPVAVAAYATNYGCILAASYEAKRFGVKTGMRVADGKVFCRDLIVISPDPAKYRFVHKKLEKILVSYTNDVNPKSIDEFVLNFKGYPILELKTMREIGMEIKERIKKELGEWITVSIGISTNRYLAKIASSYKKPDGLFEISGACGPSGVNKDNYLEVFKSLKLTDLCGIKAKNAFRLSTVGIYTVLDFYNADLQKLKIAFHSINGYYWYMKLRGYECDPPSYDYGEARKSFGNSYALPRLVSKAGLPRVIPILTKLTEKMARRVRKHGFVAQGVHLGILFRDRTYWHKGMKLPHPIFASRDFQKAMMRLLKVSPLGKVSLPPQSGVEVKNIAVTSFNLKKKGFLQLDLDSNEPKKESMTRGLDAINDRWGDFTIAPARMANHEDFVIDRIAFGHPL